MAGSNAYRWYKLGAELEFLRGISSRSFTASSNLSNLSNLSRLLENIPERRYTVRRVVGLIGGVLGSLEALGLVKTLAVAEEWRPMLKQMQDYLSKAAAPETAVLQDAFAEQLLLLSDRVASALEAELDVTADSGT